MCFILAWKNKILVTRLLEQKINKIIYLLYYPYKCWCINCQKKKKNTGGVFIIAALSSIVKREKNQYIIIMDQSMDLGSV
jgi:hypothetical protein